MTMGVHSGGVARGLAQPPAKGGQSFGLEERMTTEHADTQSPLFVPFEDWNEPAQRGGTQATRCSQAQTVRNEF